MKNGFDDVSFSDGLSYMVSNDRFNVYMDAVGGLKKTREDRKKKENSIRRDALCHLSQAQPRDRVKFVMSIVLSASRIILRHISTPEVSVLWLVDITDVFIPTEWSTSVREKGTFAKFSIRYMFK